MKRVKISDKEFAKILDECKEEKFDLIDCPEECEFEIYAEKVREKDIYIAIDCAKYSCTDGGLGFTNNEDSVYGLGGYINICEKIDIAFKNGAKKIIVDNVEYYRKESPVFILVKDCLEITKRIAKLCLIKSKVKIIAVTGSIGKTTITNALCDFLSVKYNVNRIHRIRTSVMGIIVHVIHELYYNDDFLIIEMQMDGLKQIKNFCEIAQPDYAIISSITVSHYSRFNNINAILEEKKYVYTLMKKNGKLIINGDDEILCNWLLHQSDKRIHMIGMKNPKTEISLNKIKKEDEQGKISFSVKRNGLESERYKMNAVNKATLYSAMYAIFFGIEYQFSIEEIQKGLLNIRNPIGRLQGFLGLNQSLVIMDSYNANYYSIIAGLEYLMSLQYKKKVVILGSMMELGEKTEAEHKKVGEYIEKNCDIDYLVTIGEAAMYIAEEINYLPSNHIFSVFDYDKALEALKSITIDASTVLFFKGSGAMRLEILVPYFLAKRIF